MARGIITVKPGGANPKGTISVTQGKGSTSPDGSTTPDIEIGTQIEYLASADPTTGGIGDVGNEVDFSVDSKMQGTINSVVSSGKVITNTNQQVTVNAGESVLITGTVDGKVTVNGGTLVIAAGAKILAKLESKTAASYLVANSATISAKVEVNGAVYLSLKKCTIEGKVSSDGSVYTTVRDCTIEGALDVINTNDCHCSGNTVDGNTNTPNNKP